MDLTNSILAGADLTGAFLSSANFENADLSDANLSYTDLRLSTLVHTRLCRANLSNASLPHTNFHGADLQDAILTGATAVHTSFDSVDLSLVKGLKSIVHRGPSTVGIDSIYLSRGNIPEVFLRGCGVPDEFITYARSLVGKAIEFYSCFISYSTKDEDFARRLYSRMRDEKLRVWFAPEDIKSGQKIHEQLERAIQVHDRLLIVLSEQSMKSEWVMTEIRKARKAEIKEKRRKLFPIRLVDFERVKDWECFDADTGKDLAVELREYHIPDFSNWKEHDSFEQGFSRLLRDLKAEEAL
jgi:hypothetical protein